MRKLLVILFLLNSILSASENYKLKLYEKILPIIFKSEKLVIYTDEHSKKLFVNSKVFSLTTDCNDATILIGKRFDTLDDSCKTKPIFATSYRSYRDLKSSFGSFYWRNGKPQIKFKLNKVEEFKLFLPKSLKKYAH